MRSTRLETWLTVIAALAVVGASLFTYWNIVEDREVTRTNLFNVGDSLAATIEEHLDETLRDARNAAYSAAVLIENLGGYGAIDAARLHRELNRELVDNTSIARLIASDASGRLIASSAEYPLPALSIAHLDNFRWHQAHPAESGMHLGTSRRSPVDGRWAMPYSRAIHDARGKLTGIVVAEIDIDHMRSFYAKLTSHFPAVISVINRDGKALTGFGYSDEDAFLGVRVSPRVPLDTLFQGNGSLEFVPSLIGRDTLFSYHILKPHLLLIAVGFDKASAMAAWQDRSQQRAAVVGVGSVMFIALVVLFVIYLRKLQRSDERLRERQARIASIFRSAPVGIGEIVNRVFAVVNDRFCEILGYSAEELVGRSTRMIYLSDAEWEDVGRRYNEPVRGEGVATFEARYQRKDGRLIDVLVNGSTVIPGNPSAGVTFIIMDITESKAARRSLEEAYGKLRALSGMLLNAQETERRNISSELHDEIGQALTTVKIKLHSLGRRMANASATPADVASCMEIADTALAQVRDLSVNLRPPQLELMGLEASLQWLLERHAKPAALKVHFNASLKSDARTAQADITCFRVVQEALTNAIRHARASNLWVDVADTGEELELHVRDDGAGFDADAAKARASHGGSIGLLSMEERVTLQGGSFELVSRPGAGTEIRARVPLGIGPAAPNPDSGAIA